MGFLPDSQICIYKTTNQWSHPTGTTVNGIVSAKAISRSGICVKNVIPALIQHCVNVVHVLQVWCVHSATPGEAEHCGGNWVGKYNFVRIEKIHLFKDTTRDTSQMMEHHLWQYPSIVTVLGQRPVLAGYLFEDEQLPQAHCSNNTFGINETRLSFQTDPPNG